LLLLSLYDFSKFFKQLAAQLGDVRLRGNHKVQFNAEPAFINRISVHGPLKQLVETLVKAKNDKIDVLFYVSPILVRQKKSVRRFATDLGVIYEEVRLDRLKRHLTARGHIPHRLVRDQAYSLLDAYRRLQRAAKATEEGTEKHVHFGPILQNEPHMELLPGNQMTIGGPLTIEFTVIHDAGGFGDIEVSKGVDGVARIRLNGNCHVLGKVVE